MAAATRDLFKLQDKYQDEGIAAGREGDTRDDCPYDQTTENTAWNFWVYGCESAQGEREAILSGEVNVAVYTTGGRDMDKYEGEGGAWNKPIMMPVEEAIRTGRWRPRHFTPEEVLALAIAASARRRP